MDGTRLQSLVYKGLGKAAAHTGLPFQGYRPNGALNPIDPANATAQLSASFTTSYAYGKPNTYGQATWQAVLDGSQVNVGDYLVGAPGTFFIAAKQPLLPILAVGCNRVVSITQGGTNPVAVGWPASILVESTRGNAPLEDIAGSPSTPHWWMLLPAVPDLTMEVADLVTDDLGRQYFMTAAELSDLGWRCSIQQTTLLSDSVIKHYQTVIRLIGKLLTYRQITTGSGPNPTRTTTDYPVKALISGYDASMMANGVVKIADLRVMLSPLSEDGREIPQPSLTDQIIIDGVARSVIACKPEYAGTDIAVFDVQAR